MSSRSVTVAVVSIVGGEVLQRCLAAIPSGADELLSVTRSERDKVLPPATGWRSIDGQGISVPQRRALAVRAARSEIVALIEDTCVPSPQWLQTIRHVFADANVTAAGGPVTIDCGLPGRIIALACAEYGLFHPERLTAGAGTARAGPPLDDSPGLPGNNLALRRSSLQCLEPGDDGFIESEVVTALRASGHRVVFHPDMTVNYQFGDERGARLMSRFRHGRLYAGRRARAEGAAVRIAGLLKTPLLPLVLCTRAASTLRLPGLRPALWAALPWIVLQQTAWSAGELTGYLSGPGQMLEAWS